MNISPFLTKFRLSLNPAIIIFINLAVSALTRFHNSLHFKLDYCTSVYYSHPKSQITRLQRIQNSLACTVVKAPKSSHTTPILRSLHWLRITTVFVILWNNWTHRIQASLTYKVLTATKSACVYNVISVQPPRSTRSSLSRPTTSSSLGITDHPFDVLHLVSRTSSLFHCQPHPSISVSDLPLSVPVKSFSSVDSPLSSSVSPSLFYSLASGHLGFCF